MGLSDSRQGPTTGYLFPVAVLPLRASQVPLPIFPRALPPLTPTSPTIACARYFIAGPRLPLLRLIGHSFLLCNEAETGSLALRLACSPCKASPVELLPLTLAWLLAERAIYKISSFQNIRSARIILALPKDTNDSDICGWTKSRRVRLRTVLLPSIEIRWTWCASAPYKLSSFFMSRKYMPAVCRQFDAGVLPDDQIQVTCELRQQRHAVDLDFRERGIAEIMPARHFADVAGNPIAG